MFSLYTLIRFFEKVTMTSTCWLWAGSKNLDGYGRFKVHGKLVRAHEFSLQISRGNRSSIPYIMHTCDTPSCVNPSHLIVGSHRDNMRDALKKGRHRAFKLTHCPNGHEINMENARYTRQGIRLCAPCMKKATERWKLKNEERESV
jgi:hypothetical protein